MARRKNLTSEEASYRTRRPASSDILLIGF
jgi:hypothetical protein